MIENIKQIFKKRKSSILNYEKYKIASVLLPLIEIKNKTYVLFQKRSRHVRQAGEICFPGGYYNEKKDFSYKKTAIRETCEELGLRKSDIKILGEIGTLITPMGMLLNIFLGTINIKDLEELYVNEKEVEKVFMLPVAFFKKNQPHKYYIKVHANSVFNSELGEKIISLPAKELGLPARYHESWEGCNYPVLLYKTEHGPIWGMTAEIIHEFVNLI